MVSAGIENNEAMGHFPNMFEPNGLNPTSKWNKFTLVHFYYNTPQPYFEFAASFMEYLIHILSFFANSQGCS